MLSRLYSVSVKSSAIVAAGKPLPRLCRDCIHFRPNPTLDVANPANIEYGHCTYLADVNLVTGEPTYFYAQTMRGQSGECGIEAKFFAAASAQ